MSETKYVAIVDDHTASREALRRAKPDLAAYLELLPLEGADAIFAYSRDATAAGPAGETVLSARMFSPFDGIIEDPATGSAAAAATALLAQLAGGTAQRSWRVHQGVDMGRPSLLLARTASRDGAVIATHVGGRCVRVLDGTFMLEGEEAR